MMEGVIILATEQVASAWTFNWLAFIIAFVCVMLVALFAGLVNDMLYEAALYVVMAIFGALGGVLFGFILHSPTEYETQYKVTITQDVSMTQFYEVYEIVDQDGLIFTVKEKKDD